ncbi:hypothetical protein BGX28_008096 [Mortierella sp. GBA30]|nr:hypothetical protein BGX28_008096 [Mortierella sp. GBA30]
MLIDGLTNVPIYDGVAAVQLHSGRDYTPEIANPVARSSTAYNVLLLGLTQFGKSTFIQGVKRYADPKCDIDYDTIGTGNTSHTETVCVHKIQTNFPIYRAFNKRDKKEITLSDLHALSHKAFLEELKRVDIYGDETTEADQCILRIIDTPGLDDTNKHDERNLARILTSVSELGPIHLVLFLVSQPVPLSGAMKTALETYRDTFSSINGLMVFVHTQVKTNYQHPDDKGIKKF